MNERKYKQLAQSNRQSNILLKLYKVYYTTKNPLKCGLIFNNGIIKDVIKDPVVSFSALFGGLCLI